MTKWVYSFGGAAAEGDAAMRALLGGKGANLAEMSGLGLPVPPGFTLTTEACAAYDANDRAYPDGLKPAVDAARAEIERIAGARFGDPENPLLVSVRSGARASMPGMMDTVLNLGLNDATVAGLAANGDARFAWDSYRRLIQMYGDVVLGVERAHFEEILELHKEEQDVAFDTGLGAEDWRAIVELYKARLEEECGQPFPQAPEDQLWGAIGAVFGSWMTPRAVTYRRLHGIPEDWGTAVNVQAMVFGNMGDDCATGVAFTRNPSTGERGLYGEYLVNAQGEDVVAGIRTPQPLATLAREDGMSNLPAMEEVMPELYAELVRVAETLEVHYRDMQDIEFTVERSKLWVLQTRTGKRTALAAVAIAVAMAGEALIGEDEAVLRVPPESLDQLLHATLDPDAERDVLARGLPASPGAASGAVVFDADEAEAWAARGRAVILVRAETSPEDIHGMHAAEGIVTSRGGMTSHAAVVARGMGRPCVSGAGALVIDYAKGQFTASGRTINKGDVITIDGAAGEVLLGEVPTRLPAPTGDFGTLMGWADARRRLKVRTNAETPADARAARDFGAEGIGLCRTEHMFFEADRIVAMREMILAADQAGRRAALAKLQPMQRGDFAELFRIMAGVPVTIRLLDPPLHEFLPNSEDELDEVAKAAGSDAETLRRRINEVRETNPMLGHRGCRLGISYPEIYEMQARAVFEAALDVAAESGEAVEPEIMIPLVATKAEIDIIGRAIAAVADAVAEERGVRPSYLLGTMIELPRAALRAGEIAATAAFFSFGTNDLTQTTYGISRDDSASFLEAYRAAGVFRVDPFVSLDVAGVGELVTIAVERGRAARPDLKLGICGEHGGDPASIRFCQAAGLDYVSCSPYRVPIARLAAAQAALKPDLEIED